MIGLRAAFAHQRKAANCQPPVPNPVLSFVIHTFPGPILSLHLRLHFQVHEHLQVCLRYLQLQMYQVGVF